MLEALISFALMFTVALLAMGLQAQSYRAKEKARNIATATAMARQTLEQAQMTRYDELDLGTSYQQDVTGFTRGKVEGNARFRTKRVVSQGPAQGLKNVWVEVAWKSGKVDLEGLVSKHDSN